MMKNPSIMRHRIPILAAVGAILAVGLCAGAEDQPTGFLQKDRKVLFPIGMYGLPKSDEELKAMAEAGVNLICCRTLADLDRVGAAGMQGWVPVDLRQGDSEAFQKIIESVVNHPALAVWEGPDEMTHNITAWSGLRRKLKVHKEPGEWSRQTPNAVAYANQKAKELFPRMHKAIELIHKLDARHRPIWMNETGGCDLRLARTYMDWIDIFGFDDYPISRGKREVWKIGDVVERCKLASRGEKPIWVVLQGFSWHSLGDYYTNHKGRPCYPSFADSRFMAYDVIAHGAQGILYWGTWYGKDGPKRKEFQTSLYALIRELSAVEPFLVAPDVQGPKLRLVEGRIEPQERGVQMLVRRVGDEWMILLINENPERRYFNVEVTGLEALNGRTLVELYGPDEVTVQRGEAIFRLQPLDVRLYATSRTWETSQREGRNYMYVSTRGRPRAREKKEGLSARLESRLVLTAMIE